jgi:hypothetical protein
MKIKLLTLNYQRNGVAGEPFFVATVKNTSDTKGTFVITFTTEADTDVINKHSCRVVMIEGYGVIHPFYQCWRGDCIANELQTCINEETEKLNVDMYDLHTILENDTTGSTYPISDKNESPKSFFH